MEDKVLRILEFYKIVKLLNRFCLSSMGKELADALLPSSNIIDVRERQEETSEAQIILFKLGKNPMDEFQDIRNSLKKAEIGSVLNMKELLEVAHCLQVSRSIKSKLINDDSSNRIQKLANQLIIYRDLESEIFKCIISEDEMADDASPNLSNIRRQIRITNGKIRDRLNSIIHAPQNQKYLQDPIITIRNDRYVVPVKQEYRANIPGLIHDQSSSGATLFIEPMAVVEANNDLKQWVMNEKEEINRILTHLTSGVGESKEEIETNLYILSKLDFIFAKGQLSIELKGIEPRLNEQGYIRIVQGRHPLIAIEDVVPINIWIGKEFTTLVITGPNTGGKTVTLKTVGLFTLMAQAGLHVPGNEGTELAVFDKVFADIGDEQSIEQSLSTFSSHMTNIVSILNNVSSNSLALFDELGAGTDPTEGAALAMSILSQLLERRIRAIATTHYSELKAFALTHEGIENASVEFDIETLRPTYRLSIGIPGKSNAFEISKKLGLHDDIIQKAKEYLSQEDIRFEDIISNAEYHRKIAEKERILAEEARREMVEIREKAEKQKEQIDKQKEQLMRNAREEAKRILYQAKEESENIIRELKNIAEKQSREIEMKDLQEQRQLLNTKIDSIQDSLSIASKPTRRLVKPPKDLKLGDSVYVINLDQKGIVLSKPDTKGELQVQMGIMKMKVHISNLRKEDADTTDSLSLESYKKEINIRNKPISFELDVRGQNIDEALIHVDKYLDDSFLAGITEVCIIHGKGTGILRSGIHQHLRHHAHVENYRLGKYGEGEEGVTIVKLK